MGRLCYYFLYSRPIRGYTGDGMELAYAGLSSGIPSRLRSLYDGHVLIQIVACGTAFIFNTHVLKLKSFLDVILFKIVLVRINPMLCEVSEIH